MMNFDKKKINIAIIGLGYVGLPLAIEFSKKNFNVTGFDTDKKRIKELLNFNDLTNEIDEKTLKKEISKGLIISSDEEIIQSSNIYIITVPTPIDKYKLPDLSFLKNATISVGKYLKKNDIVIYESTVFPGCTEEECVPILENQSKLKYNVDFYCGYSPERINPGDKINTLSKIKKVTSGSNAYISKFIDKVYSEIIDAGTHLVSSIKVAEAVKAIENAQRDLNISFVNELSLIFNKMDIDTMEVIDAACTKWNFLRFTPGLVGGHCIGVDPYYLSHKAQSMGYYPDVILAGRKVNDSMPDFIAENVIDLYNSKKVNYKNSDLLILGFSFKENCPDFRNTKIADLYLSLKKYTINVDIYDPYVDKAAVKKKYGIKIIHDLKKKYSCIILAVSHSSFKKIDLNKIKLSEKTIIYDLKCFFDKKLVDKRL